MVRAMLLLSLFLASCAEHTIAPDMLPPNQPPTVSGSIPDQRLSGPGEATTLDVSGHFSDPDGDALAYAAASSDTSVVTVSMAGSAATLTGGSTGGKGRVTVTARDLKGAAASATFGVVVNRAPVASVEILAQTLWHGATRVDMDLTGAFSDPDGDDLTYTAGSSDTSVASVELHPGPVVSLAGPVQGEATVTVTANDPDGLEARAVFPVAVVENPDQAILWALREEFVAIADRGGGTFRLSSPSIPEVWRWDVPLGDWYGVDVNGAGRVVCLGVCWAKEEGGLLQRLSTRGGVPPELGSLEALEYLALGIGIGPSPGFGVGAGSIPVELGALANLEVLHLGGWLTGPIPPEFGDLAALKGLSLRGWHLSGPIPPTLQNLANLERLSIGTMSRADGGSTDVCVGSDSLAAWLVETMGWSPDQVRRCRGSAHLIQVVQSRDASVPLVADRSAALRTFDIAPPARARFYLDGTEVHVADVYEIAFDAAEGQAMYVDTIAPAAVIPRSVVQPGLEMVVEWDQGRFPQEGCQTINVVRLPPLELTLVPLVSSNPHRDDSFTRRLVEQVDQMAAELNQVGFGLLPAHGCRLPPCGPGSFGVEVKTHPIIGVFETNQRRVHSAETFLGAVGVIRQLEGGTGYWMGIVGGEGPGGLAVVGGYVSWSAPESAEHELGHNLGLRHPPNPAINRRGEWCDAVITFDSDYPYRGGRIGAWGYDLGYPRFVPPNTPDLMTYCYPSELTRTGLEQPFPGYGVWISDYHYKKALDHRRRRSPPFPAPNEPVWSLLLWGGYDAVDGAYLEPAFVVDAPPSFPEQPGPWKLEGRDSGGRVLFSLPFAMPEIADVGEAAGGFAYTLPVRPGWEDLASVTLTGPGGTATLDESTNRPLSIYRDGDGKVRAILRGDPVQADGAAGLSAGVALDVVTSRGIPSPVAWR